MINDSDDIDLDGDDDNFPNLGSGSVGWPAGGINIPITGSSGSLGINGSGNITINGQTLGSIITGIQQQMSFTMAEPVPKTDIRYIIVQEDGTCLELEEQQVMTPREMLNICKFINLVQAATSATAPLCVHWSQLIVTLGIQRHFQPGLSDYMDYDNAGEILYVYLFDETT